MDAAPLSMLLVGHSFISQPLTDEVLSRQPDVVFLEIGCNEIDRVAPFVLAEQVFQFAKMLVARGVRRVSFASFFWDAARSRYHVVRDFNDRVTQYNQRMHELTMASAAVDFWRHRGGMWAIWRKLLCDGIHYTNDGHRRYYSSVRGALIAASLIGNVSYAEILFVYDCKFINGLIFSFHGQSIGNYTAGHRRLSSMQATLTKLPFMPLLILLVMPLYYRPLILVRLGCIVDIVFTLYE